MPGSYAQSVADRQTAEVDALRAFIVERSAEGGVLSPEDAEAADKREAEIERLGKEVERALRLDKLAEGSDALRAQLAPTVEQAREERRDPTERELLARFWKTDEWFGGFDTFTRDARPFHEKYTRAMAGQAGTAIDRTFYDQVTIYEREFIPVMQLATVLETPRGEPIDLPRYTADPSTGGTVTAEAAGILEADPTLGVIALNAYKYAVTTIWSRELDTDNVIGLEDLIAMGAARELAFRYGAHFTTGDDNGKPNGIVTAATAGATAIGTAAGAGLGAPFFGPQDLIDIELSVLPAYRQRPGAGFMVSSSALAKMRKFRATDGQFLWQPAVAAGQPSTYNGYPVYENPAMAAAASASKSVLFGAFSSYVIRRLPMRVERSTDYKFANDQVALKTVNRVDGDLQDVTAVKSLVSANV